MKTRVIGSVLVGVMMILAVAGVAAVLAGENSAVAQGVATPEATACDHDPTYMATHQAEMQATMAAQGITPGQGMGPNSGQPGGPWANGTPMPHDPALCADGTACALGTPVGGAFGQTVDHGMMAGNGGMGGGRPEWAGSGSGRPGGQMLGQNANGGQCQSAAVDTTSLTEREYDLDDVSYVEDIAPIFELRCATCHSSAVQTLGLDLSSYEAVMAGSVNGPVVVPGSLETSELLLRVTGQTTISMPLGGEMMSDVETAALAAWIAAGAPNN